MANSVPDTNTFTLQNVVDVVGGTSLTAAFANATAAYFDSAYVGVKDRLSNFRNYKVPYITVSPANLKFYDTGDPYTDAQFSISSNVSWTVVLSDLDGIIASHSPTSGSNNGTVTFSVNQNFFGPVLFAAFEVTNGTISDYCYICQDGTAEYC